jgi:hypothetical protein
MLKKSYIYVLLFLVAVLLLFLSCDLKNFFEQPTVEVEDFSLRELPGDMTKLDLNVTITNNDHREGNIGNTTYTAVIEGIESEAMEYALNETIPVDTPLQTILPLDITTDGAAYLLSKLENGEELTYQVTGTFHEIDRNLDLPIDITGTALVEVGYEEYFEQPEVTVNDVTGTYSINGMPPSSYTFDLMVNCDVQNMDVHSATIDEVEYIVYLEGVPSDTELYEPDPDIFIDSHGEPGDTVNLDLPVVFNTNTSEGATIVAGASDDGKVAYIVEGTFHAMTELNDEPADFYLPLYVTGETSATIVQ